MTKADPGSLKALNSRMKAKGLQRLRWYCQICAKQCRCENSFKQHCLSESHTRQMLIVGEDPKKYIEEFSNKFQRDFIQLLRTSHGEKQVHINQFYQTFIADKEHTHMNATKWSSLTEFAKFLGQEGICRVEENEKGIHVAWIDKSPEALRRQEALRRKEAQDRGNEEVEQMLIREQINRARKAEQARGVKAKEEEKDRALKRQDGDKITLSFGPKTTTPAISSASSSKGPEDREQPPPDAADKSHSASNKPGLNGGISLKAVTKPQTKNVFATAKKNALASGGGTQKGARAFEVPRKMSEAERIMKAEMESMERKRARQTSGSEPASWKKQRTDR
ncbi:hypothetical protein ACRALDRAFT_2109641 [Sodiomyces alcalophilus JCM 7366]|uniref:uncharacterized protein n=1 Tax=Sodiomyces alcalophilus JCM 7366 TaxID=591952 RepID=UPI0039B490BA